MATARLYAQCHCRRQTFHFDVDKADLPVENWTCHCDDCRHLTGLLYGDFIMLPASVKAPFDEEKIPEGLSLYKKENYSVKWYFCNHCGAHIIQSDNKVRPQISWFMSVGTLYPLHLDDGTATTRRTRHMFVRHGRDMGGLARWLPDNVPRYIDHGVTLTDTTAPTKEEDKAIDESSKASTLPLQCHCGHVKLEVHRPSWKPVGKKWQAGIRDDKWMWSHCLCNSCRTASGFDVSTFFFVPYSHISTTKDKSQPTDALTEYKSSEGVRRFFCPTCGACIFYDTEDRGGNDGLADIFVGLVDAPLASFFDSWAWMAKELSYWPYAKNKEIAGLLKQAICPNDDLTLTPEMAEKAADYDGTLQV